MSQRLCTRAALLVSRAPVSATSSRAASSRGVSSLARQSASRWASSSPAAAMSARGRAGVAVPQWALVAPRVGGARRPFSDGAEESGTPSEIDAPPKLIELCDQLCDLNVVELSKLSKMFQNRLGLSDAEVSGGGGGGMMMAAPMAMPAAAAGGAPAGEAAADEAPAAEKEYFDLKLVSFDDKSKIKVIKEVRAITGLGLKESKELVEGAPKVIKKELKKDEAEALKEKLAGVGAVVELE